LRDEKPVHVRNAPKATAGGQDVGRREGPEPPPAPKERSAAHRLTAQTAIG
jgi:hypothetical protein